MAEEMEEVLKPLYSRASEAEERLLKLEALLSKKGDADTENKEVSSVIKDFQSKLEIAQTDLMSERENALKESKKLVAEIEKLQYRITHLLRALSESDSRVKI